MSDFLREKYQKLKERFPKIYSLEKFMTEHRIILKRIVIVVSVISIIFTIIELPREIYFSVRSRSYNYDMDNRDYWPVHDYYGNNVNIFEFEDYLENNGGKDIIKGYYYKDNGNTAICYDFHVKDVRILLDNEIKECPENYYSINISSQISIYVDDKIYKTDYCSGADYVMDYRSPMWVDRRIFNVLHDLMDDIANNGYDRTKCPFEGMGVDHYEEDDNGYVTWHDDAY